MTPQVKKIHKYLEHLRSSHKESSYSLPSDCLTSNSTIVLFDFKGEDYLYYHLKSGIQLLQFEDDTTLYISKDSTVRITSPVKAVYDCELYLHEGKIGTRFKPVDLLSQYTTKTDLNLESLNLLEDTSTDFFHSIDLKLTDFPKLQVTSNGNYICKFSNPSRSDKNSFLYFYNLKYKDDKFYLLFPKDEKSLLKELEILSSIVEVISKA